jgi:hypothetical protein
VLAAKAKRTGGGVPAHLVPAAADRAMYGRIPNRTANPYEISNDLAFVLRLPPVNLQRDLGDPKNSSRLLIQKSANNQRRHFPL